MVVVGWRLFSLSVAAALLGAETALAQNAALAQMSTPCVNDAPDPYRRGASFGTLAIASRCSTAKVAVPVNGNSSAGGVASSPFRIR
jgi:hypothetical protein